MDGLDQLNRQYRLHYNSLLVVFNFSRKLLDKKPETSKYKFVTADLRHIIYLFCIKHLCLRCRGERAFISILHSSLGVNAMLALWIESVKQMPSEVVLAMGAAYMRSPENVTLGRDAGNACATWHGLRRCGPMQGWQWRFSVLVISIRRFLGYWYFRNGGSNALATATEHQSIIWFDRHLLVLVVMFYELIFKLQKMSFLKWFARTCSVMRC